MIGSEPGRRGGGKRRAAHAPAHRSPPLSRASGVSIYAFVLVTPVNHLIPVARKASRCGLQRECARGHDQAACDCSTSTSPDSSFDCTIAPQSAEQRFRKQSTGFGSVGAEEGEERASCFIPLQRASGSGD